MKSPSTTTELLQNSKTKKILRVGYTKICSCPENHTNCLTPKEWVRNQVAIWEFAYEKRDTRDKNIHPAVFPIGLPKRCIELFTHKGELVLDPFVGIGTTLLAASDTDRNAVGFDIKKEYLDYAKKRLSQTKMSAFSSGALSQILVNDDARNVSKYLEENTISLVMTSPPYADMLRRKRHNKSMYAETRENEHYDKVQQYSENQNDLGTLPSKIFAKELSNIYLSLLPLLKPKAHAVININDPWCDDVPRGRREPLHAYIIEEMQQVGYELRNVIIWDKRNLVNNVGIFGWPNNYIKLGTTFEYILDFWKP